MVTTLDIKEFTQSNFYNNLFIELDKSLPQITFNNESDYQMYNIFAKMLNNANLSISDLYNINTNEFKNVISYGLKRLLHDIEDDGDFSEGYDLDDDDKDEVISFSYDKIILIQILVEYLLLTQRTKNEFMDFLKKQKIPSAKKFLNELIDIFEKSK